MAHGRSEAFDMEDCRMMEILANFAAMGVRQQRQKKIELEQTATRAASEMAHDLAHKINNPLQSLTNVMFLVAQGADGLHPKQLGQTACEDLERLSALVKKLLAIPFFKATQS